MVDGAVDAVGVIAVIVGGENGQGAVIASVSGDGGGVGGGASVVVGVVVGVVAGVGAGAVFDDVCGRLGCFDMVNLLVLQEFIEKTQIGSFDGHVRRRRPLHMAARQGDHRLGRERLFLKQEETQRVVHGRLAVVGRVLQNT
jgi:hypothetical protein